MKVNNTYLTFLLFIGLSSYSYGDERRYQADTSLRNSTHAVIALKVGGRIDCNTSNSYPYISLDNNCFGANVTEEMKSYNIQRKTEDFLVLKSLKGEKKQGDIIKVNFKHEASNHGYMNIGSVYLIFFHQENGEFYYEYCDVLEYRKVEKILKKNMPFEKLVDLLLHKNLFICPEFEAMELKGSK